VFFRSLAQDCGALAIAVILPKAGSDGSRGIRAVHEAGGPVLVHIESAQFDGCRSDGALMPGVADHKAPPQEMPLSSSST
jgi:two-component system CheB/CheR fusion protein